MLITSGASARYDDGQVRTFKGAPLLQSPVKSSSRVKGSINARAAHGFGGFGDLAVALALKRLGAEIVVSEQSPALNEVDAGLNLSPKAPLALRVA